MCRAKARRYRLLFLRRRDAEMGPDLFRQFVLDRARVRSLVRDPDLRKIVKNRFALDFKFPR
jgi:hypothetical protein